MYDAQNKLLNLLIIDDDKVDVEAVRRLFEKKDIHSKIVTARDGIEGLEILEQGIEDPFIILLDFNMPRMNGIEFLKALRSHHKHKNAIVFVWSTSKNEVDVGAAYEHQIAGYLLKDTIFGQDCSGIADILEAYERNVVFPP